MKSSRLAGYAGLVLLSLAGCGNKETEPPRTSEPAVIYARDVIVRTEQGNDNPSQFQKVKSFYEMEVTYEENGIGKKQKMRFPIIPYDKPQIPSENSQESAVNQVKNILENQLQQQLTEFKKIRGDNIQQMERSNKRIEGLLEQRTGPYFPQVR